MNSTEIVYGSSQSIRYVKIIPICRFGEFYNFSHHNRIQLTPYPKLRNSTLTKSINNGGLSCLSIQVYNSKHIFWYIGSCLPLVYSINIEVKGTISSSSHTNPISCLKQTSDQPISTGMCKGDKHIKDGRLDVLYPAAEK